MQTELKKLKTDSIHNINHNNSTYTQVNEEHLSFRKLSTNKLQKKDVPTINSKYLSLAKSR
jgi:hypothetical protein